MNFAGMNPLAIALAAIAALFWSGVFFRVLGSAGGTAREARGARSPLGLLLTTLLAELVMAWVLAGTLGHLGVGQVTLRNGVISASFVWAGFIATTLAANGRLGGAGWRPILLDAAHWLVAVLLMGAVIGGIGV